MHAASPPERSLTAYTLDEQPDPSRERRTYRSLKRPPASSTKSGRTAVLSGATGCSEAPCIPPGQQVGLMNRKRRGTAARHDRRPHVWRAGVGRAAGRVGAGSGRPATLRTASSLHQGGGRINGRKPDQPPVIRVIREGPARHGSVAGAPKHRQRILSVRRSGWCRNAGPQQWYYPR